ncbi:putative cysteine desulfurase [Bienertia sinuspersici]
MCMFNSSCALLECPRLSSNYDVPNYYYCMYNLKEAISTKKKLDWLRSNLIGDDLEFISPFGKRKVTYLDCTASGRCLRYIEDYIIHNVLPFYGNTHTCDSYVGQETTKMVTQATNYIKSCLGGGKNDALIFCGSGSTSAIKRLQEVMGITLPSIMREKMLQLLTNEERWVVFVGPHEHHSNYLSWKQSLVEVVEIGMNEEGLLNLEELEEKLKFYHMTSKRSMMGSFSACSNVTGTCLDTRKVATLLHQYGAFACFDFASSGPYVDIKMRSGEIDGYDAIFLSPHKFLGGPGSPGILMMNKALYHLGSSPPSTCGGGTVDFVNCFSEKRENAGTPPIIQKIKAALAFWVKEYIGCEVIQKQEAYFIDKAMERLVPNPKIYIIGNTKAKRQAILSFQVYSYYIDLGGEKSGENKLDMWGESGRKRGKPLHGAFIVKLLNDLFGIQGRGGCACAGPYAHRLLNIDHNHSLVLRSYIEKGYLGVKSGWARINFPYYLSNDEFEFILLALEFIASFGQRFLAIYNFNWKTGEWKFCKQKLEEVIHESGACCYISSQKLASDVQELSLDNKNELENNSARVSNEQVTLKEKYGSYLKNAMHIAHYLPICPEERSVPQDIDPQFLLYRV